MQKLEWKIEIPSLYLLFRCKWIRYNRARLYFLSFSFIDKDLLPCVWLCSFLNCVLHIPTSARHYPFAYHVGQVISCATIWHQGFFLILYHTRLFTKICACYPEFLSEWTMWNRRLWPWRLHTCCFCFSFKSASLGIIGFFFFAWLSWYRMLESFNKATFQADITAPS